MWIFFLIAVIVVIVAIIGYWIYRFIKRRKEEKRREQIWIQMKLNEEFYDCIDRMKSKKNDTEGNGHEGT